MAFGRGHALLEMREGLSAGHIDVGTVRDARSQGGFDCMGFSGVRKRIRAAHHDVSASLPVIDRLASRERPTSLYPAGTVPGTKRLMDLRGWFRW